MHGVYQSNVDILFHRPAFESVKKELILAYNKENKISNFKKNKPKKLLFNKKILIKDVNFNYPGSKKNVSENRLSCAEN